MSAEPREATVFNIPHSTALGPIHVATRPADTILAAISRVTGCCLIAMFPGRNSSLPDLISFRASREDPPARRVVALLQDLRARFGVEGAGIAGLAGECLVASASVSSAQSGRGSVVRGSRIWCVWTRVHASTASWTRRVDSNATWSLCSAHSRCSRPLHLFSKDLLISSVCCS